MNESEKEMSLQHRIPAAPSRADEPCAHVTLADGKCRKCGAMAVPPSASPERPGVKECGCVVLPLMGTMQQCGTVTKPCEEHRVKVLNTDLMSPPSSPERERAQDTPWQLQMLKTAEHRFDVTIKDASGNIKYSRQIHELSIPFYQRIVAAVNGEAGYREAWTLLSTRAGRAEGSDQVSLTFMRRAKEAETRLKDAERLLDRAEDAVRPGGLRNEIRTWLAESRR